MSKSKPHTLTVKDLEVLLGKLKQSGQITENTEVWLSSDEEGNDFGPLVRAGDGTYNIGLEDDKSKLTLYPISQ